MKRIVSLILCAVLLVGILPCSAFAVTTLDKVSVTLSYPESGKLPPSTATCNGSGYSIYDIEWEDLDENRYLEPGEKIQAGHEYLATIWVEADSGYEFRAANDNTPSISATVNGEDAEVAKAYEYKAWAMMTMTYYFEPVPPKGWLHRVDLTVPTPVAGEKPDYTKIEGTGYYSGNVYFSGNTDENMVNGIAWYVVGGDELSPNSAVFAENTAYRFHCLLFPQEGYRFTDLTRVFVNGKQANAMRDYATFMSVKFDFPATGKIETHTHTPSQWRTTQVYHYKVCTTCGEFLEQADHYGGTATCTQKPKCTACGYAYGRIEPDHRWSPTYLYQVAEGHAWICADCKDHSTVTPHTPGPAATETTPQTCKDCGYIITPIKNHTHKLNQVKEVPATCDTDGTKAHYACEGCSDKFADAQGKNKVTAASLIIAQTGHKEDTKWTACAGLYHAKLCTVCGAHCTIEDHTPLNALCTVCGYDPTVPETTDPSVPGTTDPSVPGTTDPTGSTEPGQATDPTQSEADQPTEQPQKADPAEADSPGWLLIALVGIAVFALAVTATVLILKKKK